VHKANVTSADATANWLGYFISNLCEMAMCSSEDLENSAEMNVLGTVLSFLFFLFPLLFFFTYLLCSFPTHNF